jgi:hypothetical protein
VESLAVAEEDKAFLTEAGLPKDAAPELSFAAPKSGELPTVADQYDLSTRFRRYRVIGSDGAGNPIAIDENRKGEVVLLAHDEKFARTLINKTVRQLAESLVAYRDLAGKWLAENEEAGEIPEDIQKQLHQTLKKTDSAAMKTGCFWPEETKSSDVVDDYLTTVLEELRSADAKSRLKASKHLESELRKGVSDQRRKQFGNKAVTSALIDVLDDANPKIVHNVVVALTQVSRNYFKDDRAYSKLLPLAHSTHPLTARWTIDALINLRGEASLDDVLPLCASESWETREVVLHRYQGWLLALKSSGASPPSPKTRSRLREAALHTLNDAESAVRASAAELLGEVGWPRDVAALRKCLENETYWLNEKRITDAIQSLAG